MKVLVTGAGGFLGRQLVPALVQSGHSVRAASRSNLRADDIEHVALPPMEHDVDWLPLIRGVDVVIHLAGIAHATTSIADSIYDRVNHRATAALARAAACSSVSRFVFVSSIRAQSGAAHDGTLTEESMPRPTDAYGRSKLAGEVSVAETNLKYTILRPVLIYGPGLKGNLAQLAWLARSRLPLPLGAFSNRRSLLGIRNFIAAVEHVITSTSSACQTYVVADPTPMSLAEMLACLRRSIGRSPWLVSIPRQLLYPPIVLAGGTAMWSRLAGELVADPAKLMRTGWKPVATSEGLPAIMSSRGSA